MFIFDSTQLDILHRIDVRLDTIHLGAHRKGNLSADDSHMALICLDGGVEGAVEGLSEDATFR
jgi:hypothetical protein